MNILLSLLFTLTAASAASYTPEVLREVGARVEHARTQGLKPVVVFDLDDTLNDSRSRTVRILDEFAEQEGIPELRDLPLAAIHYLLVDTFKDLGLDDLTLVAKANAFWNERFFSNKYVAGDRPITGAAAYVRWLTQQGAKVVYLTGRPQEDMQQGTIENLVRNRFPLAQDGAVLIMKPDKAQDDLVYKTAAFARIKQLGTIVGAFENEPRNINAMQRAFPQAIPVYIDTIHSNKPDVPASGIAWIKNFRAK